MAYDRDISLEPMYRPAKYCSGTQSNSTARVSCSLCRGIVVVSCQHSAFDLSLILRLSLEAAYSISLAIEPYLTCNTLL